MSNMTHSEWLKYFAKRLAEAEKEAAAFEN
jgi:hypothetical protein